MAKAHVLISGQVQGVGFRYFLRGKLVELGLTGWVKNLPDGKVEAEVEGEKEKIEKIVEWCKQGPPLAKVKDVKIVKK